MISSNSTPRNPGQPTTATLFSAVREGVSDHLRGWRARLRDPGTRQPDWSAQKGTVGSGSCRELLAHAGRQAAERDGFDDHLAGPGDPSPSAHDLTIHHDTPVTQGLLPDCAAKNAVAPCVVSRATTRTKDVLITVLSPAGDPGMKF